ncbi:unnamed protein product [Phytophthora lilii]|uniref:Unnamed protein product n=1 Tax=Phytophthora lilii TaxID=2077276 RepID=A0A9W6WNZ6_9STRA|nr:unnamed protein product [Phytophthora lilii]
MLPNLSDRWGATLQVMLPTASEPANVSARRNALYELNNVNSIRISHSSGKGRKTRYAVDVFVDSPDTNGCSGMLTAEAGPRARCERGLSEFKDVADELHDIVDSAHSGLRCELCSAILNWFVFGENPDGLLLMFSSNDRVARKLTKFLEDLLAVTVKYSSTGTQGCCYGQIHIPQVVHEFLFNQPATCDAA